MDPRHDADQVISGYANPSGSGEGNWADETTLGRIRKDGGWDRRYASERCPTCDAPRHPRVLQAAHKNNPESVSLKEFFAAVLVCLLFGIAFFLWTSILAVS